MHTQTMSGIAPHMQIGNFSKGLNRVTNGRFLKSLSKDNIFRIDNKTREHLGMPNQANEFDGMTNEQVQAIADGK